MEENVHQQNYSELSSRVDSDCSGDKKKDKF